MDVDERNGQADRAQLEDLLEGMRKELRNAIRTQEQLGDQLRAAVADLSRAASQQKRLTNLDSNDRELQRLESRVRGVEQRLNRTAEQVQGMLQSRIWRTLVSVGGVLLRFSRIGRSARAN